MPVLEVTVFDKGEKRCAHRFDAGIEVGRQRSAETLYEPHPGDDGRPRLAVAAMNEDHVGRRHAFLEPLGDDRLRITNLSQVQPVYFESPPGPPLMPGEQRAVAMPQLSRLGPP